MPGPLLYRLYRATVTPGTTDTPFRIDSETGEY